MQKVLEFDRAKLPQRIAVLVTTYQRPAYLRRCLRSLASQTRLPDRVLVVVREDDVDSFNAVEEFQTETPWMKMTVQTVIEPGPVAALKRGFDALKTCDEVDLVLVIDDDAEAAPDWVEKISRHFCDSSLGVVAGRVVAYKNEALLDLPEARHVGRVAWYGRHVGNMYKPVRFSHPVEVDAFMAGNFAIRQDVLGEIELDTSFVGNALEYELDIAYQVKHLNCRLLFDPLAQVHHFDAPRAAGSAERSNTEALIYSYSRNHTYVMMKRLPLIGKLAFFVYFFLIGERHSWGLATMIADALLKRRLTWRHQASIAFKGKLDGLRAFFTWRRNSRLPATNCREELFTLHS
jgi:GT2 family glycosyltransferase